MNIALLAHEKKKELMVQFCIAYQSVLGKHELVAPTAICNVIRANTDLKPTSVIGTGDGAEEQIASRISCGEVDILLFFRDPTDQGVNATSESGILRLCDVHNVPVATNIATGEVITMALDRGDLDWIEYNKK